MKKLIALTLAAMMIFAMSACGDQTEGDEQQSADECERAGDECGLNLFHDVQSMPILPFIARHSSAGIVVPMVRITCPARMAPAFAQRESAQPFAMPYMKPAA